ncbi:hypothetical protein CCH79_00019355 [Gambusia affinis]|uniref:Uncharacterized protein n=1 Tax=Gambusia affinis TaxID=33528 RepID=A0A315UXG9_GAMAF|nr:hypothetical protein CCH79_00019355 [Gambusia affinis]
MGFLHQLHLLLWKNISLKRRGPIFICSLQKHKVLNKNIVALLVSRDGWKLATRHNEIGTYLLWGKSKAFPGQPSDLVLPVGRARNTSPGRRPGGILTRCPNHLNWILSMAALAESNPHWKRARLTAGNVDQTLTPVIQGPDSLYQRARYPKLPWVLAFEIFIPLVLFFILLGLRQKKPAIPVKEDSSYSFNWKISCRKRFLCTALCAAADFPFLSKFWVSHVDEMENAAPLTSAGIIPIMQSLCPDGQRDEFGFLQYKNSTVTQLLERISEVVEQNRFFTPDRPGLGQDLETLQQQLESLSAAPLPPDYSFNRSQEPGSLTDPVPPRGSERVNFFARCSDDHG